MSPRLPMSHKRDKNRAKFMKRAAPSRTWSHPELQRFASQALVFQHLYGELESALQLYWEGAATRKRSADENFKRDATLGFV